MNYEILFNILSYIAGPFWLLILFFPQKPWAMRAVDCLIIILAGLFAILTIPTFKTVMPLLLEPEFATMKNFLGSNGGFVGTWNHMILADVWIGRWMAIDTLQNESSCRNAQIIRLIFIPWVLLLGPFGLFFYLLYRMFYKRKFAL